MIRRVLKNKIAAKIDKGKAIILIGPRQVGKTTLINSLLANRDFLFLDGDDPTVRNLLNDPNTQQLKNIIGNNQIIFIDEAQRIKNIGLTLKLITDQFKSVQLFVSGSSANELSHNTNEPLTGRKWEYQLFPISWKELEESKGFLQMEQELELRILYGMYPDVINHPGEELEILRELVNSYLYKDLLAFGGIRKPEILEKLLQALALQLGNEVSYNELSQLLGIDKNTVSSYIDILAKGYVIYKLPSFSKNLRNEIKTNQKIYFYDTGIRNMILGNFNALDLRTDKGALWENFLITERIKNLSYEKSFAKSYFWRTTRQQEIDYVEETAGIIKGYEFKWNKNAKVRFHKPFLAAYNADITVIHRENFRDFIL
ncbi:ATP-binding protein [Maribacter sp. 2304DJ31-5]|uniref:ATP-binding protein n=1 Tax=Maribacter sp. 2304DJ31-5 TaxID=3386273 RepID=UPI0039BCE2B6